MIDRKFIGYEPPPHSADVEAGRLRFFAKAIGQTDPIYSDEKAAREAGYRSLPAPPTFLFGLDMDVPDPFALINTLEIDLARVLHGEQTFKYHHDVCAGDTVTFQSIVSDIFDKKNGALEFVVEDTTVTNQDGIHVADMQRIIVVRN